MSVGLIEELTTSNYYKNILLPKIKDMTRGEHNLAIISEAEKQLREAIGKEYDVVLIDRSLNDRAIWNHRCFINNDMSEEQYKNAIDYFSKISKELIDMLVISYADSKTALQRDYLNSLALEERRFLKSENIDEYNRSMEELSDTFDKSVENVYMLDTTDVTPRESSVLITESILPVMRKRYINSFVKSTYK